MKTTILSKTLLALVVSAYSASAFPLSDLLGSWTGPRTDKEEGDVAGGDRVNITGEKRAEGGIVLIVRSKYGRSVEKHQFRDNGRFVVTREGRKVAFGQWKKQGGKIVIDGKRVDWGDYDLSGTLEMSSEDQFKYVWTWGKLGSTSTYKIHRVAPPVKSKPLLD